LFGFDPEKTINPAVDPFGNFKETTDAIELTSDELS
jgi:hypothetical protein